MSAYCITESADEANFPMCKEIAETLSTAYPGYGWHVRIDGGLLIIKSMKISTTASMVRHYKEIAHDAGIRKKEVIMAAGEFLEAAHMRRGRWQGENAKTLEGLDGKFKPIEDN